MTPDKSVPEKQISDLVEALKRTAGDNLESVVLYGSAVTGDYDPDYSNVNLVVILKETSLPKLLAIAPLIEGWVNQKRHAPLLITRDELERSADVFAIELMDIKQRHRVLFGSDPIAQLSIPMHLHRAQLEYELREKLILLRQRLVLVARDEKRSWELLLRSLPTFTTLFRHALIAQGSSAPSTKRESVKTLAGRLGFDASPFEHLLDIREHRADQKNFRVQELAARYLAAVEQVTGAVDRMLDSPQAKGS
jgi:predicted nucleotidyltransferase